jgi:hypothetical protein
MLKTFTRPITLDNWKKLPVFAGRLATKQDVDAYNAMFCTIEAGGKLSEINLPFCAIYTEKQTGKRFSVVAVQAESAHGEVVIGAIKVAGETLVCTLSDLEIVGHPDEAFFKAKSP